jgi:hypothetical protein
MIFNNKNNKKENKFEWYAGGSAPGLYPTKLFFGDFILPGGKRLYIPPAQTFEVIRWGESQGTALSGDDMRPAPVAIDIIWLSMTENQFYSLQAPLPTEKIAELLSEVREKTKKPKYNDIVVGMAPYGGLAVWLDGEIRTLVAWMQAEPVNVDMKDFRPRDIQDQTEYVDTYLKNSPDAYENLQKNGLPDKMLYNNYMKLFNYRLKIKFENEEAVLESIYSYSNSGEVNIRCTNDLLVNTMRSKPRKIELTWHVGNTLYQGYFWTDDNKVIETFDRYYQGNMQKEGELVFEIGKDNNKFRIYLQDKDNDPDNPMPVVEIPDEEIRIIIFKDHYECYRNPSYTKDPIDWDE